MGRAGFEHAWKSAFFTLWGCPFAALNMTPPKHQAAECGDKTDD
jgi:hypothetical protein